MKHRHLSHEDWTLVGIDSCITRGNQKNWDDLRKAGLDDPEIMDGLRKIAGHEKNLESPYDDLCYKECWRWVQDPGREAWGPNFKNCGGV